jgi:hypothetical protein
MSQLAGRSKERSRRNFTTRMVIFSREHGYLESTKKSSCQSLRTPETSSCRASRSGWNRKTRRSDGASSEAEAARQTSSVVGAPSRACRGENVGTWHCYDARPLNRTLPQQGRNQHGRAPEANASSPASYARPVSAVLLVNSRTKIPASARRRPPRQQLTDRHSSHRIGPAAGFCASEPDGSTFPACRRQFFRIARSPSSNLHTPVPTE